MGIRGKVTVENQMLTLARCAVELDSLFETLNIKQNQKTKQCLSVASTLTVGNSAPAPF